VSTQPGTFQFRQFRRSGSGRARPRRRRRVERVEFGTDLIGDRMPSSPGSRSWRRHSLPTRAARLPGRIGGCEHRLELGPLPVGQGSSMQSSHSSPASQSASGRPRGTGQGAAASEHWTDERKSTTGARKPGQPARPDDFGRRPVSPVPGDTSNSGGHFQPANERAT